jgi:large subunit ribosomal protein L25
MAGEIVLEVASRDETGKNACRRLRAKGKIPGNVYGLDRPPFMVAVDPAQIEKLLRLESGANTIFSLALEGQERRREAMIKELQRDPVTELPVHVDFVRVDPTQAVHVQIPIQLIGIATGVKNDGGVMDFVQREVSVECLPGDIPEHLDVDVSALHINQHVALKDLQVGERVQILDDPEQIVAVVVPPRVEEVVEEAAEEEGVEAEPAEDGAKPDEAAATSDEDSK